MEHRRKFRSQLLRIELHWRRQVWLHPLFGKHPGAYPSSGGRLFSSGYLRADQLPFGNIHFLHSGSAMFTLFPRSSYLITIVFMTITAAVLAEICSALPLSGSIYIWAAESAGPKYARFFGFTVAWWSCTAWMTFVAGNCQVCRCHLFVDVLFSQAIYSIDDCQLYRLTISCLGCQLSWRCWQWQHQVAVSDLGYFGRVAPTRSRNQLPTPTAIFAGFPRLHIHHDAGFLPLRHLASNWSLENIWIPVCARCVPSDRCAFHTTVYYTIADDCYSQWNRSSSWLELGIVFVSYSSVYSFHMADCHR